MTNVGEKWGELELGREEKKELGLGCFKNGAGRLGVEEDIGRTFLVPAVLTNRY